jgi:hypothetical protein
MSLYYSQAQTAGELTVGLKTGLTLGNLSTDNRMDVGSYSAGYSIGAAANFDVTDFLGVSLDVQYLNVSVSNVEPDYFYSLENSVFTDKIVNSSIRSSLLSLPLTVSYVLPQTQGGISPRIYAGGDVSFNLQTQSLNTYSKSLLLTDVYTTEYESMGERVSGTDFGLIFGTSLVIPGDGFVYTFDARYRMGLSDINETQSVYVNSKLNRNYFSVMVGIAYKL